MVKFLYQLYGSYSCEQFLGHILQVQCKLLYMQNSTLQSACTELSGVHVQIIQIQNGCYSEGLVVQLCDYTSYTISKNAVLVKTIFCHKIVCIF